MDEWVKMRYIYTMEYFSAIKTNGIVPYVIPWSALEYIILFFFFLEEFFVVVVVYFFLIIFFFICSGFCHILRVYNSK